MLGCYSEVVACSHECDKNCLEDSMIKTPSIHTGSYVDSMVPTAAFGGFGAWPLEGKDFILLAECSELHGPCPLFTIPNVEHMDVDLNLLCLHILSADFQGLCSDLGAPTKNTQLLMPDVLSHVHVAVNHFTVFDVEARGFVRPLCLAYITSDKYKLIELSEDLFKNLAHAAEYIQLSNCKLTTEEIDKLLLDSQFKETDGDQFLNPQMNCTQQDIEGIRHLVKTSQNRCRYSEYTECFILKMKKYISSDVFENVLLTYFSPRSSFKAQDVKFSLQQHLKKNLRHLFILCPDGILFGLYHLFITIKYFGRGYEDILIQQEDRKCRSSKLDSTLCFGACVRCLPRYSEEVCQNKCLVLAPNIPKTFDLNAEEYFDCIDSEFGDTVKEFLEGHCLFQNGSVVNLSEEIVLKYLDEKRCHSFHFDLNSSVGSFEKSIEEECPPYSEGCISMQPEDECPAVSDGCKDVHVCCQRHTFTLCTIWSIFDSMSTRNADSIIFEILQIFHQTESIFFSLLTRSMIVVVSSLEDATPVHLFVEALGTLVPRTVEDKVWVEPCRRRPLEKQDLIHLAVVGFCLSHEDSLIHFISPDIMPFISILNLREKSFSGPRYVGCLLSRIDEHLTCAQTSGAVFPIFFSILTEVEASVKLWSALSTQAATQHLLQKGFTSCDIQIVEKLSKLCIR